jgi:hypothetical protein
VREVQPTRSDTQFQTLTHRAKKNAIILRESDFFSHFFVTATLIPAAIRARCYF